MKNRKENEGIQAGTQWENSPSMMKQTIFDDKKQRIKECKLNTFLKIVSKFPDVFKKTREMQKENVNDVTAADWT